MNFDINIKLEDNHVLLRRYQPTDLDKIAIIADDADIWKLMVTRISNREELKLWEQTVVQGYLTESRYTFMIIDKVSGALAGSTSFGNISKPDKRLEIGWTWLSKEYPGSGMNHRCKYLLLRYAFDKLGIERVEIKTDVLNMRSRKALLKIGATEEGILRSHTLMHDGRRRDTIYYSILRTEWNKIKQIYFKGLES
jgi:N-acetyltransferase